MSTCHFCSRPVEFNKPFYQGMYWNGAVTNNQHYLGYTVFALNRHASSLSELTSEEWTELSNCIKKFEKAAKTELGAGVVNWMCLMNGAFKQKPFNPHVHFHAFPRYEQQVEFSGETFNDTEWAGPADLRKTQSASSQVIKELEQKLSKYFSR